MNRTLNGLLVSRKVWLAAFAVVTSLVAHYANVPQEVWVTIDALVVALIAGITIEDAALKLGKGK